MVSRKFKIAVKLSDIPAWKIARQANINPNVLSKIMSGAIRVKPGDCRVIAVGKVLGIPPEECFQKEVQHG